MTRHDRSYDLVRRLLWQIESDMERSQSLTGLAQAVGLSPFHLSRMFTLRTGQSLMGYVRARRLSRAAHRIANGDHSVTDAAFAAGYDSVEGFSRAFRARFGIAPSSVRRPEDLTRLCLQEALPMTTTPKDVTPLAIRETPGLTLLGKSGLFTIETRPRIPALWSEVAGRWGHIMQGKGTYGVCYGFQEDGAFRYMPAFDASLTDERDGLETLDIPTQLHAVFEHRGHVSSIAETWDGIFANWAPGSEYDVISAPEIEYYRPEFDPAKPGNIEIWIPISPRS